jgi:hypothetical protein
MARQNNFLLGHGERLTQRVDVPSGGGEKNPPYNFQAARARIATRMAAVATALRQLPDDAAPNGQVVAVMTMHPRYIAKSDFPSQLLDTLGLRAVGSRSRTIRPESWGIQKHPDAAVTEDIFVTGSRDRVSGWAREVSNWSSAHRGAEQLSHVEDVADFSAREKLRMLPTDQTEGVLEIVLHNAGDEAVVDAFIEYARRHGASPIADRRRNVKGLTFVPVRAEFALAEQLARFSFVRVARPIPTLRPLRPRIVRTVRNNAANLPTDGPHDTSFRALVFDGGLPDIAVTALTPWVTYIEAPGIGPAVRELQDHGLAVTAALLFGPINGTIRRPIAPVDHVRVLDGATGTGSDLEYLDVLDRITTYLDQNTGRYQHVNLSIGPNIPITDDEVTAWTASLDERFAGGNFVVTVAAGNDGDRDAASGLNRVQPPADGVNVLGVGASDANGVTWQRAIYSCVGPGRSPGLVKPDGIAFGGSDAEPFIVLAARPGLVTEGIQGTSFASPFTLGSSLGVRAQLGTALTPLSIRALMVHRADPGQHGRPEIGWGRFESDAVRLITCEDDEALVVYQGNLPVGEHLRARVPVPREPLRGNVQLSATLVIAPEVDPEYPGAYTRSGLEVAFRPDSTKFNEYEDGRRSAHPQAKSFFSASNMYGASEFVLRDDGHKWEPCLRHTKTLRATSLDNPCFDIYYHHRQAGIRADAPQPIPYAFIVSLRAPRIPDLYNRVVRAYSNVLVPLRPRLRIQVQS